MRIAEFKKTRTEKHKHIIKGLYYYNKYIKVLKNELNKSYLKYTIEEYIYNNENDYIILRKRLFSESESSYIIFRTKKELENYLEKL